MALGVVMASAGYPAAPRCGDVITACRWQRPTAAPAAAPRLRQPTTSKVFHAGTALHDGAVVTAGGRVLCVTALGDSTRLAQQRAYEEVQRIGFCRRPVPARHRPAAIKR